MSLTLVYLETKLLQNDPVVFICFLKQQKFESSLVFNQRSYFNGMELLGSRKFGFVLRFFVSTFSWSSMFYFCNLSKYWTFLSNRHVFHIEWKLSNKNDVIKSSKSSFFSLVLLSVSFVIICNWVFNEFDPLNLIRTKIVFSQTNLSFHLLSCSKETNKSE